MAQVSCGRDGELPGGSLPAPQHRRDHELFIIINNEELIRHVSTYVTPTDGSKKLFPPAHGHKTAEEASLYSSDSHIANEISCSPSGERCVYCAHLGRATRPMKKQHPIHQCVWSTCRRALCRSPVRFSSSPAESWPRANKAPEAANRC